MLKYVNTMVTFSEVPEEISLCIEISNCPCHCCGCHSPYLAEDIGIVLDRKELFHLLKLNRGITAVCFMGGDVEPYQVLTLAREIKEDLKYKDLKVGWYSGRDKLPAGIELNLKYFDYIKLGPYIKERGPLNCKTTNQRMYKIKYNSDSDTYYTEDITYKFQKDENKN